MTPKGSRRGGPTDLLTEDKTRDSLRVRKGASKKLVPGGDRTMRAARDTWDTFWRPLLKNAVVRPGMLAVGGQGQSLIPRPNPPRPQAQAPDSPQARFLLPSLGRFQGTRAKSPSTPSNRRTTPPRPKACFPPSARDRDPGPGYPPSLDPISLVHEVSMPTEAESNDKALELVEEIVERFRPIEHLFDVMGAADSGVQGVFVRRWAEIGMHLAKSFREHLDQMVVTARNDD